MIFLTINRLKIWIKNSRACTVTGEESISDIVEEILDQTFNLNEPDEEDVDEEEEIHEKETSEVMKELKSVINFFEKEGTGVNAGPALLSALYDGKRLIQSCIEKKKLKSLKQQSIGTYFSYEYND